jgi:nitrogen fixation protein
MATTEDRFWRFAETLVDVERFLSHQILFPAFEKFAATNTPLVLISEKLHYMYLKKHLRKDFVKNYTYKEDFENLLILVNNNFLMRGKGINATNWEALGFKDLEEATRIKTVNINKSDKSSKDLVDAVIKKPAGRGKKA